MVLPTWLSNAATPHLRRTQSPISRRRSAAMPLADAAPMLDVGGGSQPSFSDLVQPLVAALRQVLSAMYVFTLLLFSRLSTDSQRLRAEAKAEAAAAHSEPKSEPKAANSAPKSESKAGSKAGGEYHPKQLHVATHAPGSKHSGKRFAYVTLFTKDAYLPGVQALWRSMRCVGSSYPLIVMYTAGVGQEAVEALRSEGCIMQFTKRFNPNGVSHGEYKRKLYLECWCKLRMWEMVEYDRLVYLDADMIVCANIDHLFELPQGFFAVGDCYGGRETAEERDSCCHHTPEKTPEYFNAGFYVCTPSMDELAGMEQALEEGRIPVRFFAEQDFLNGYFKGRWTHLPYTYNAQKRIKYHHPQLWHLPDINVIHYVDEKPWSHRYSEENQAYRDICDMWWAAFEGKLEGGQHLPAALHTGHAAAEIEEEGGEEAGPGTPTELDRAVEVAAA